MWLPLPTLAIRAGGSYGARALAVDSGGLWVWDETVYAGSVWAGVGVDLGPNVSLTTELRYDWARDDDSLSRLGGAFGLYVRF